MHIHNYNKCIYHNRYQKFHALYHGLIQVLKLITGLFSVGTPVGVTELILITEVLVSTTKLILVLRILYLYYEVYPGLTELILAFRIREYP